MKHFLNGSLAGATPHYRWINMLILAVLLIAPVAVSGQAEAQSATRSAPAPNPDRPETVSAARSTVIQLATSRALPNVLVANLTSSDNPLRYSLDNGRTWQHIATPSDQPINNIAVAPRSDGSVRILVTTGSGYDFKVYRTGDFGATWADQPFPSTNQNEFAVSPADSRQLYVTVEGWYGTPGCFPFPACDTYVAFLYTSSDAGVTWIPILSREYTNFGQITASPIVSTTAYIHTYDEKWIESPNDTDLQFPIDTLALDPVDPARMYGVALGSTASPTATISIGKTSVDGGKNWLPWPKTPSGCVQLMAHPRKSGLLYLRCSQGLYRSIDSGQHWRQLSPIQGDLLAPNYGSPGHLLWARADGLWASNDDGNRWKQLTTGWGFYQVYLPVVVR
jgi:hypothetical protein